MPRIPRQPTRAHRLASAIAAFDKAQRELAEIKLTGVPRPLAAELKLAREAAKNGRTAAEAALKLERPNLTLHHATAV